eukprot:XP_019921418.1 PREDICTED: uncharacterized protein LOC109618351 [Crassostrea gigas]
MVGSLVSGRSNLTEHSRPFEVEVESQNQTETGKTPDKVQCSEENACFGEVAIAHDVPVDFKSSSTCNESECSDTELQTVSNLSDNGVMLLTLNPEANVFIPNSQTCSDLPEKRENEHMANSILEWKLDGRTVPPDHVFTSFIAVYPDTRLANVRFGNGLEPDAFNTIYSKCLIAFIITDVIPVFNVFILESAISVKFVIIVCKCCIHCIIFWNVFQLVIAEDHEDLCCEVNLAM